MKFRIPPLFTNKYFIAFLAVMMWLMFFDKNNMIQHIRMQKQLNELRRDKQYYQEEIVRDSMAIKELRDNPEALETLCPRAVSDEERRRGYFYHPSLEGIHIQHHPDLFPVFILFDAFCIQLYVSFGIRQMLVAFEFYQNIFDIDISDP
jgi:hypothetical protein